MLLPNTFDLRLRYVCLRVILLSFMIYVDKFKMLQLYRPFVWADPYYDVV